jgi:maltose alpha-D-glucosyltransferase/alpha-amylase
MMRTLRECPEINTGSCTHVDAPTPPGVLAHRADDTTGTMLFLHNRHPSGRPRSACGRHGGRWRRR